MPCPHPGWLHWRRMKNPCNKFRAHRYKLTDQKDALFLNEKRDMTHLKHLKTTLQSHLARAICTGPLFHGPFFPNVQNLSKRANKLHHRARLCHRTTPGRKGHLLISATFRMSVFSFSASKRSKERACN